MLKLDLFVYDAVGSKIDALCVDNAAPQQIHNVWMFLKPGMSYSVHCTEVDLVSVDKKTV